MAGSWSPFRLPVETDFEEDLPAVPETLPVDNPNLQIARRRLQRTQWLWALLLSGMGWLAYGTLRPDYPIAFLPWIAAALLLVVEPQPILLALTAMMWALSIAPLVPSIAALLGPDPLTRVFEPGSLETLVAIIVRLVLAVTALNQFTLYRMLYGTRSMSNLDPELPFIPEVVKNRSDSYALAAIVLGCLAIVADLSALPLAARGLAGQAFEIALSAALFALGLGLGTAFSPTSRRPAALLGIGLGAAAYLLAPVLGSLA